MVGEAYTDFKHILNVHTFVGAEEVQELTLLRDQNKALIKLVGELKAENPTAAEATHEMKNQI